VRRRVLVISDEEWGEIIRAASPLTVPKKTRRELERTLRAYQGFPSRAGLARTRVGWRRINQLTIELDEALTEELRLKRWRSWPQKRWRSLIYAVRDLRQTAETIVEGLDMPVAARKGRRDPAREWLYCRLLAIWTDLGGRLGASTSETGGPAVRFIRAACALVDVKPSVSTVRAIVKVERRARKGRDISSREK
jgi:hypothetical protein